MAIYLSTSVKHNFPATSTQLFLMSGFTNNKKSVFEEKTVIGNTSEYPGP